MSLVRCYYRYLKVNFILTDDDKIILHASRCLTRFCNSSSDVDVKSYINKLYRLFLYVFKFFRNWHLPSFGSDISVYSNRIRFIIKTGIKYEKKKIMKVYEMHSTYVPLTQTFQIVCLRCLRTGARRMSCRILRVKRFNFLNNFGIVVRHTVVI